MVCQNKGDLQQTLKDCSMKNKDVKDVDTLQCVHQSDEMYHFQLYLSGQGRTLVYWSYITGNTYVTSHSPSRKNEITPHSACDKASLMICGESC